MPFCSDCGSFMVFREGVMTCPKCGVVPKGPTEDNVITSEMEVREQLVLDEDSTVLPKTRIQCPKCENKEAYWQIRQTRAADEPETRIYRCTSCEHTWREY